MSQDYRDRVLQSVSEGRKQTYFWEKLLVTSTVLNFNHLFSLAGNPGAGDYTAATAKAATAITGGSSPVPATLFGTINFDDPTASYDALVTAAKAFSSTVNANGTLILVDLLALYRGCDANSNLAQPMTVTPTTGDLILPRYTDGKGVMILSDVQVALGAVASAYSVVYTDQGGATGTTPSHTLLASAAASKVAHQNTIAGPFMKLASGDTGVKSIQSMQFTVASGAGTVALWLCKPLLILPVVSLSGTAANFGEVRGIDDLGVVEIFSGAALSWVWVPSNTVSPQLCGTIDKVDVSQAA
jgi:hypothetical protein